MRAIGDDGPIPHVWLRGCYMQIAENGAHAHPEVSAPVHSEIKLQKLPSSGLTQVMIIVRFKGPRTAKPS